MFDRWDDPELGELVWNAAEGLWNGEVRFEHRIVRVWLDPDRKNPTAVEQAAIIEPARRLFAGLSAVEPMFRQQAAVQIAGAVAEQAEEGDAQLPLEAFAGSLELEAIALHSGGGSLYYRSPEFFPGQRVTIFFDETLAFGDAEVNG